MAASEKKLTQLNSRRQAAEMAETSNQFVHQNISLFLSQTENIDPETQQTIMKKLVKGITVYNDNIEIRMFSDRLTEGNLPPPSSPNKKEPASSTSKKPALYADGSSNHPIWLGWLDSNPD